MLKLPSGQEAEIGVIYDIKYPIKEREEFLTVSTTRPETIFGDCAVAINSSDDRSIVGMVLCSFPEICRLRSY